MLKGPWKKGPPGIEDCIIDAEGYTVCERVGDEWEQSVMLLLPELVEALRSIAAGGDWRVFDSVAKMLELTGDS